MIARILLVGMIYALNVLGNPSSSLPKVSPKVLKIGVYEWAPFAFREKGTDSYQGISIDVWESIAQKNGLSFKYIPVTKEEGIKGISTGKYDILLGGIPDFVQEKGNKFEYTLPFYVSGLGIVSVKNNPIKVIINYFISWNFLKIIIFVFLFIVLQTLTLWVFERKINPSYKGKFWKAVGTGLWWSAGIAALNEAGDVYTKSLWGRIIAIFWMFGALIMVNVFTGSIASKLTIGELSSHVEELSTLRHVKVVCLEGTASKKFLNDQFISCKVVSSLQEGFNLLHYDKAQALIYDEAPLKYELNKLADLGLHFIPAGLVNQYYSFMLPVNTDLRYFLNQEILKLINMQEIQAILLKYFGKGYDLRNG